MHGYVLVFGIEMHFGTVKFNGFFSSSFKKWHIECFSSIFTSVKSTYLAIKKDSSRIALMVFQEIENNFRGNMKPCR